MSELSRQVKARYSCKRKRDVVTFTAITMFALLVVFQLYLTLIAPLQLKAKNMLVEQIAKDELFDQVDRVRRSLRRAKFKDKEQLVQKELVSGILGEFALFLRKNADTVKYDDVVKLRKVFSLYDSELSRWYEKPPCFPLRTEQFQEKKFYTVLESMTQD